MSHGCVNMRIPDAKWLFLWALPIANYDNEATIDFGTSVYIY